MATALQGTGSIPHFQEMRGQKAPSTSWERTDDSRRARVSVAAQLSEFAERIKPEEAGAAARPGYARSAPKGRSRSGPRYQGSQGYQKRRSNVRTQLPHRRGRQQKWYWMPKNAAKEEAPEDKI